MKIEYKDNLEQGAGNGILIFTEVLVPASPWAISIQRASDQKFMTGNNSSSWTAEAFFMPMNGKVMEDGSVAIFLGPEVVNSFDQQEQYKVELKGSEGASEKGRLRISTITYSPSENLNNTAKARIETKTVSAPPPEKPLVEQPIRESVPEETTANNAPLDMQTPIEKSNNNKKWGIAAFLVLALVALLCFGWYWFSKKDNGKNGNVPPISEEKLPSAKPTPKPESTPEQKPESKPESKPDVQMSKPSLSTEDQVRQFFNSPNRQPSEAIKLAESLTRSTPADQDAIYRLYYYAASKDIPESFMQYALFFDPTEPQCGTIEKNAVEAYKYYKKASTVNPGKAEQAMKNLLDWLEEQTRSGNTQAIQWLEEIKKL